MKKPKEWKPPEFPAKSRFVSRIGYYSVEYICFDKDHALDVASKLSDLVPGRSVDVYGNDVEDQTIKRREVIKKFNRPRD